MKPVRVINGRAVPLDRSDVDTDQIIPASWLKRVERTGFGQGLFSQWRDDRDFVLNKPEHAGANILVAGPNFGTGSSREHAVWALVDYGFEAVISPRFGDIFRNNATKAGLLPVQVEAGVAQAIMAAVQADPALEIMIDVERRHVDIPAAGIDAEFPLDPFTQHRLLEGLDDIGISLQSATDIDSYESNRPSWLPSVAAR
ncbi:MAG TPA: 3-isopropylmalate dehydratase small subunit [Acidimicrobiales bacterium]|nr:3-isopropylmalate dehydratase small subunit [Acidimicrobiales bacterium]